MVILLIIGLILLAGAVILMLSGSAFSQTRLKSSSLGSVSRARAR